MLSLKFILNIAILIVFYSNQTVKCFSTDTYGDLFKNKNILITGGTGFLGTALISEIIKYNPKKIIIFSRDEVKHHKTNERFGAKIKSYLGDIRDYQAIEYATRGIDIVIHAAALKRIDMLEFNVHESIETNIVGTMNVAKACIVNHVQQALLVSTDKACLPINTYGACKFIAEKIFTNFAMNYGCTKFTVARFGNVLQSTGSVIPFFCEKIKSGVQIPLTHTEMTRFFIAKDQAVRHIFKALKVGQGGEIFIPQLPAFKIVDLIDVLQDKFGKQCEIKIVGIRPGEKLHELMINIAEAQHTYKYEDMLIILPTIYENFEQYHYLQKKDLLVDSKFSEYASNDHVLDKQALSNLLDKYALEVSI